MLHSAIHLTPVFLLFQGLTLVVLFFTFTESQIHFGASLVVYKHKQRNDGIARLFRSTLQRPDRLLGE